MSEKLSRIYVGCSLLQAPEDFKESVKNFKDSLREENYEVFDFVGLTKGTEADVYNWDIKHCVRKCDILVGVCDYPSIGLGWELAVAQARGIPVLATAHIQSQVTRLVLGAAVEEPNFYFERYTNLPDIIPVVNNLARPASL